MNTPRSTDTEIMYRKLIDHARLKHIPLMGICAGVQQIGLKSGASLDKVKIESSTVELVPGTFFHYLAMTKQEQDVARFECQFPNITLAEVSRAHSYAIDAGNIVRGLGIDSKSKDGVVMSVHDFKHPYIVGFQFHPESAEDDRRQENIWNNFFVFVREFYENTQRYGYGDERASEYIDAVQGDLAKCGVLI